SSCVALLGKLTFNPLFRMRTRICFARSLRTNSMEPNSSSAIIILTEKVFLIENTTKVHFFGKEWTVYGYKRITLQTISQKFNAMFRITGK
ncbi:MAG TPA: hypothetical protein VFC36_00840, partial [Paludibacter sp.]|nr:hypothetical protein [Paludibacter sp.]